jgi:hypothetical protein
LYVCHEVDSPELFIAADYIGVLGREKALKIRFDRTPKEIEEVTRRLIEKSKKVHDQIASIPLEKVSVLSAFGLCTALYAT